ncbi:MAG: sugar ABC transporter permease [Clostridia bacterium]|nr:sugar ABC transporter permease [Clostridia bacterium]
MPKRKKSEEMPELSLSAEELARREEGLRMLEEAARRKRRISEADEIIRRGKKNRKRFRLSNRVRDGVAGYMFILPWIIGFSLFFLFPLIESLIYSFNEVTLDIVTGKVNLEPIGIAYYRQMFSEDFTKYIMWCYGPAMLRLFEKLPIITILSLFVAIMLNQKFKGRTVFRAIFFLPVIIASGIIITTITSNMSSITGTREIDQPTQLFQAGASYVYSLLDRMNVPDYTVGFIRNMVNRIFNTVWLSGIQILLFLSALQTIPASFYEASTIEGASGWVTFWKITFPIVSPFILVNIVYTTVDTFSEMHSNTPLWFIIEQSKSQWGYSAACAWMYFISLGLVLLILLGILNKFVFYQVD